MTEANRASIADRALEILDSLRPGEMSYEERMRLAAAYTYVGALVGDMEEDQTPRDDAGSLFTSYITEIASNHLDVHHHTLQRAQSGISVENVRRNLVDQIAITARDDSNAWAMIGAMVAALWRAAEQHREHQTGQRSSGQDARELARNDLKDTPGWD